MPELINKTKAETLYDIRFTEKELRHLYTVLDNRNSTHCALDGLKHTEECDIWDKFHEILGNS